MNNSNPSNQCSKPWCKETTTPDDKACNKCQERDREAQRRRRAKIKEATAQTQAINTGSKRKVLEGDRQSPDRAPRRQKTHENRDVDEETEDGDEFDFAEKEDFIAPDEDVSIQF